MSQQGAPGSGVPPASSDLSAAASTPGSTAAGATKAEASGAAAAYPSDTALRVFPALGGTVEPGSLMVVEGPAMKFMPLFAPATGLMLHKDILTSPERMSNLQSMSQMIQAIDEKMAGTAPRIQHQPPPSTTSSLAQQQQQMPR